MLLRLMDMAHGIVANFLQLLSVGACMVADPPLQDGIHNPPLASQEQETSLPILPSRTINDLPTEESTYIDLPVLEPPHAILPARTIDDLPTDESKYIDLPVQEPLAILPARTINDLPTEESTYLDIPVQETPLAILPARTIDDLPTEESTYLDIPVQETPLAILPARTIDDLPTEILDRILEYFQDDASSLKTFSLISRPFLSICRKRLFSTLCLNSLGPSFSDQCDRWMFLLKYSTDFVASLQILELGPAVLRYHTRGKVFSDHWIQIVDQGVPSIHDQRVQTIIQHALNPQTLILRFEFQAWKNYLPTFQDTVIELIQRRTVSSLSLEDVVDFPMVALSGCRYLRELSLISSHTSDSVENPGSSGDEVLEESKGYLESLTLFASDQYVKKLINVLSFPRSLLNLTKLRRLSINLTGSDGRLAMENIPPVARGITNLELRSGENADYDTCDLRNFPNLRSLLISISYNRHKQPIRDLATFLSKSDKLNSTPSTLEELKVLFRHDVQALQHERSPKDTMHMFQHRDWKIMEHKLRPFNLFPTLRKLRLGLRPKDVGTFMSEPLRLRCISSLSQLMPTLCAVMDPTIEVFDDRFEQFTA